MVPTDEITSRTQACERGDAPPFHPVPGNGLCERLSDKWSVTVLWRLQRARDHRLRFSALKKELDNVTQRMLTLTLRNLEREGLVAREYYPEIPPRVEYTITELGAGALKALESLNAWVRQNLPTVEERRRAFDQREN